MVFSVFKHSREKKTHTRQRWWTVCFELIWLFLLCDACHRVAGGAGRGYMMWQWNSGKLYMIQLNAFAVLIRVSQLRSIQPRLNAPKKRWTRIIALATKCFLVDWKFSMAAKNARTQNHQIELIFRQWWATTLKRPAAEWIVCIQAEQTKRLEESALSVDPFGRRKRKRLPLPLPCVQRANKHCSFSIN